MTISSSSFAAGHAQADSRRYVREEHTDHLGAVHVREYGPVPESVDCAALLVANAARLEEALADGEFADRLARIGALALQHQTAAQFAARLRERYRGLEREDVARLAWWIIEQIAAGHVTDAQVRNAFGLTVQQYNSFKSAKLQPMHDRWAALQLDRGE